MKNYYEILEVHETASPEVIARVYKLLAKKYHPDLQENDEDKKSEEKFKEISEAYEVLSNEEKRKSYDEELLYHKNVQTQAVSDAQSSELQNLQGYCAQLENEIHSLRNAHGISPTMQNLNTHTEGVQRQAREDAMNQAYNDAYYNTLRSMGYKVRYKKTLKERFKNFVALVLTIVVLAVIGLVLWNIPSVRERIVDLFTL